MARMARKQSQHITTRGLEGKPNTEQNPTRESDLYQTQDDKGETTEFEMKKSRCRDLDAGPYAYEAYALPGFSVEYHV